MKKERMVRMCSKIGIQNMVGYLIREADLQPEDIATLEKYGYKIYGVRQAENKPFTIEKRIIFRGGRIGIAVFKSPVVFPKRDGLKPDSMLNYFTMNNQYSWFDKTRVRRDFAASVNRPGNTVKER